MTLSIAEFILLATALVVILKDRRLPSVILSCGAVLLALIELLDAFALKNPVALPASKHVVVVLKALMPVVFISYTMALSKKRSDVSWHLPGVLLLLLGGGAGRGCSVPSVYRHLPPR